MAALLAIGLSANRRACRQYKTTDNVALSFVLALILEMAQNVELKPKSRFARPCRPSHRPGAAYDVSVAQVSAESPVSEMHALFQCRGKGRERHDKWERAILQPLGTLTRVPARRRSLLASMIINTPPRSVGLQAPCPLPIWRPQVAPCHALRHRYGSRVMFDRCWRQTVEARNPGWRMIRDCTVGLNGILRVSVPREPLQEAMRLALAAVEGSPARSGNRVLLPRRKAHRVFGSAAAAARSFAFGFGGLSRSSTMRPKSRSDTSRASASAWTVSTSRSADWITKLVRSVWRSAAARIGRAFTLWPHPDVNAIGIVKGCAVVSIPKLLVRNRYVHRCTNLSVYALNAHSGKPAA